LSAFAAYLPPDELYPVVTFLLDSPVASIHDKAIIVRWAMHTLQQARLLNRFKRDDFSSLLDWFDKELSQSIITTDQSRLVHLLVDIGLIGGRRYQETIRQRLSDGIQKVHATRPDDKTPEKSLSRDKNPGTPERGTWVSCCHDLGFFSGVCHRVSSHGLFDTIAQTLTDCFLVAPASDKTVSTRR